MAGTIVHLAVATQLDQLFANEPERYLGKMADKYCSNDFLREIYVPMELWHVKGTVER